MPNSYRLTELIRAVCVDGEQAGTVEELPAGAIVTLEGDASVPGLIEINATESVGARDPQ